MIDIHMHIIPSVDDGAVDLAESKLMLLSAINQGVTGVVATSHGDAFIDDHEYVLGQYEMLRNLIEAENLPIDLYLGCEVYCYPSYMQNILKKLECGILPTMNGTKYVLTEYYDLSAEGVAYCLQELLAHGWIPIIAHAERYKQLDVPFLKKMKEMGCRIQINAYSVCQEPDTKIREKASCLLEMKLADFIGSDAHRMGHRPPEMETGVEYMREHYNKGYVNEITNACLLLQ